MPYSVRSGIMFDLIDGLYLVFVLTLGLVFFVISLSGIVAYVIDLL